MKYNLYRTNDFILAYHLTHIDLRTIGKSLFMRNDACFIVVIHFCIIQNRSQVNSTPQSLNYGGPLMFNLFTEINFKMHQLHVVCARVLRGNYSFKESCKQVFNSAGVI